MIGNSYGKSTTFPVRRDMPNSQQVMSDPEFESSWQSRLANVPQFIGGNETTTQDWAPGSNMQSNAQFTPGAYAPGGAGTQSITMGQNYGFGAPGGEGIQSMTAGADYNVRQPMAAGATGVQNVTRESMPVANPEYARIMAEMQAAMQQRQESQTAQQQAYNGQLGQGQKNGVMGDNYSTPGFGRVDGQSKNPYAINSGSNNMDWASGYDGQQQMTGVYDPVKQTQETFWGL